jgi:predicted PurR-regulated permease PerM
MKKHYTKYMFLAFFVVLLMASLAIVGPFLAPVVTGLVLGYLFYPLYKKLDEKLKQKTWSAVITTILIILVILVPFSLFLNAISKDVVTFYSGSKQLLTTIQQCTGEDSSLLCTTTSSIRGMLDNPQTKMYVNNLLSKSASLVLDSTSRVIVTIPRLALYIVLTFFVMFYTFIDGPKTTKRLMNMLPLKKSFKNHLIQQTEEVVYATVYGNILIAIFEGVLAMAAFALFGIPSPVLWGVVVIFVALLPLIGATVVWVPASAYLIIQGYLTTNSGLIWKGIGLAVFCFIFISSLDTFIKPKIIGNKSKMHPVLILLGIFGGISLMGFIGLIIGPVILAIFTSFIQVYERDKDEIIG